MKHPEKMSPEYVNFISSDEEPKERIVCDYISGMTDQFAISTYEDLCIPSSWKVY